MKANEQLNEIFDHYGSNTQLMKFLEEISELAIALMRYQQNPSTETRADVIEEMADVNVMLMQFENFFDCQHDISKHMAYKVNRTIRRIAEGK